MRHKKINLVQFNMVVAKLFNRVKFSAVFLLGLGLTGLQAQESINATGRDASGSGGTAAYSLGQVVYTTNSGTSGTVSQGVQQAYEIFTVGIKETELNISLSVFPNPTIDHLTLHIQDYNNEKLIYKLFDMQGKLLSKEVIISNQTQINISDLPVATYLMIVMQKNRKVQSFKIIKQ